MPVITLSERRALVEAAKPAPGPGRLLVRLIDAGKGSSGVYPADTLKAAAEARVFAAGTQMFLDHETETEKFDRPERTVRDLAAVLAEDARWDEASQALVAEARVYSHWREAIAEMAPDIGVSIRAMAETAVGEFDGQPATIVTRLTEAMSVDFVTKAGRGGKVLEVIESARARATAPVREATSNTRREELNRLVKDAYAADKTWVWLRDFDDSNVWFEVENDEGAGIFQQAYTTTGDVATALSGDRVEVRVQTTYVPVTQAAEAGSQPDGDPEVVDESTTPADEADPTVPVNPAGQSTPTQESEEDTMPQIEEARLRQLEEDAGRVHALETERDTAVRERDEAVQGRLQAEAATYARDFARNLVTKANGELTAASVARIVGEATRGTLPLTEAGRLDTEAFTPVVEKERQAEETYLAQVAEASGVGTIRGLGAPVGGQAVTESDVDRATGSLFGRTPKEA